MEFSKIFDNPGLRSLNKLMMNSFRGKFCQLESQPETSIVNTPAEFFNMMSNPSLYVNSLLAVNKDTLIVNWEYRVEAYDSSTTVNVVLAACITA